MVTINDLFAQLGLATSDAEIELFINMHKHLPTDVLLSDAPFWSPSQSAFLQEELIKDADWAEVIDQLNVMLHDA